MDELKAGIKRGKTSLFLDFDGTLTPIVSTPEKAFLSFQVREVIRRLCSIHHVVIVSGREINDIKDRVGVPDCIYVGNNGLEIEGTDISFKVKGSLDSRVELEKLLEEVKEALRERNIRGAVVEDKRLTAAVHYRLLDKRDIDEFLMLVKSRLRPYLEKRLFRIVEGKNVVEIRPNIQWDKGKAVEWLMTQEGFKGSTPIYIGDDETDRDAFRAIRGKGVSIAVGPFLADSDYYLRYQGEVKRFLRWIESGL